MDEGYYWQKINYLTDKPVPRVVRWYLATRLREGSIRNLTFTPKTNKTWVSYEWRWIRDDIGMTVSLDTVR